MKIQSKALFAGILLAALSPFALATFQAEPAKSDGSVTPTPTLNAAAAEPAAAPTAPPVPETPLHEVDAVPVAPTNPAPLEKPKPARHRHHEDDGDNRVTINDETVVGPNDTVEGNAVSIMGPLTVDGTVEENGVSVMGRSTINGTVHGNAVAVLGNLRLGPNARVDGNAVSVGGRVIKDPNAVVGGNVVPINLGADLDDNGMASSLWRHGFRMGRPMAYGPHLHLFWVANLCVVAVYLLLALLFPNGVRKCADTLAFRPGITFLTGFLAIIGLPVLFILLCITVVGIPVAIVVLPVSIIASVMFGKAAVYSFIGRSIIGKQAHIVLATLVGIVVAMAIYFVPGLGFLLWFLVAFLGFACALTTLFLSSKAAPPARTPPAAPGQPLAAPIAAAVPVAGAEPASAEVPPPVEAPLSATAAPVVSAPVISIAPLLPPVTETALPRAGFWIRMLGLLIDLILIGIVTRSDKIILPALALYGAVLWKLRGSTVGGIILGLKVVRHDGRPMDWATAVVRALACFFSLIFLCLGFFWIAFDPEKQGWHDKIAGTVVVRLPKGISLV